MVDWKRTHYCGTINEELAGRDVTLNGWVNRRRDLGGMISSIFEIDLVLFR